MSETDVSGVQTCYRHEDRRAGVRCQRCGRPICPECMTQASVGFQCPECLRGGRQRVVTARNLNAATQPVVTIAMVALNVALYFVSAARAGLEVDYGLIGLARTGAGELVGVAEGEWYRIVTGGFLHASLPHIGFNMFALWILGKQLEPVIGGVRFALVYVASLLGGSLGVLLLDPNALTVGASGAVFGLFGFAFAAQRARGINPMQSGLGAILAINLAFTFLVPNISIGGHLGGLIAGYLCGQLIDVIRPRLGLSSALTSTLLGVFAAVLAVGCVVVGGSLT